MNIHILRLFFFHLLYFFFLGLCINQENNTATTRGSTDNFFQNVRELQVAELGIFRDLGPYGRLEE